MNVRPRPATFAPVASPDDPPCELEDSAGSLEDGFSLEEETTMPEEIFSGTGPSTTLKTAFSYLKYLISASASDISNVKSVVQNQFRVSLVESEFQTCRVSPERSYRHSLHNSTS